MGHKLASETFHQLKHIIHLHSLGELEFETGLGFGIFSVDVLFSWWASFGSETLGV